MKRIKLYLFVATLLCSAFKGQTIDSLKLLLAKLPAAAAGDIKDTSRCRILDELAEISAGEEWKNYNELLKHLSEQRLKKTQEGSSLQKLYTGYLASAYSGLGSVNYENGNILLAIEQWQLSLDYYEKINDVVGMATDVNNLGVSYLGLGELDKSLEFLKKSYHLAKDKLSKSDLAQIFNNIGYIYTKKNNLDTALFYYGKALRLCEESNNSFCLGESLNHIGYIFIIRAQPREALRYFLKGIEIREKIGDKKGTSNSLNNIATCYIDLKDYESAFPFATRALDIARSIGHVERIRQAAFNLKIIYENKKDYRQALEMNELFVQMRDSTMNESTRNEGLKNNLKYEFEKKELLLKEEQVRREALNNQRRSYYIIFAIISILLIGTLFALLYLRLRHKKEKEKHDLMSRVKDSEIKALQLQMNPHFIFNSLNSVLEFISRSETEEAIKYLTKFSRLIRIVLEFSNKKNIFISEEMELLRLYIELENIRSEKGFDFNLVLEEGLDPQNYQIYPMLLQPFIENSIIHGIQNKTKLLEQENKPYRGELQVTFAIEGEFLKCIIKDNGIGREKAIQIKNSKSFNHLSLGMQITRERLNLISQQVNKIKYTDLKDENNVLIGTHVEILIPLLESF